MSSEILRRAAALLREQFPGICDCAGLLIQTTAHEVSCSTYASDWPRAVADWLDAEANLRATDIRQAIDPAWSHALNIARIYLGESA